MIRAGIIDNALERILVAPVAVCSKIAELLRLLTNNNGIARSLDAARTVEPLFMLLQRPDFTMWRQQSALGGTC